MKFNPNDRTKRVLKKLSEFIGTVNKELFFVVMGGIAVDGYVGEVTRSHPDVDMLIFREDIESVENILISLGYLPKKFNHPKEADFIYKMQTRYKDHLLSFQILDKVGKNQFEISFYRDPHLVFPLSFIKPPKWLTLEGVYFPVVSKEFLIELKEREIDFYEKLKREDFEKYKLKRKKDHLKILHDIKFLHNL